MFTSHRPPEGKRCFRSAAIDQVTLYLSNRIKDPELAWLFQNCFPNTLDTTVDFSLDPEGRPDSFVITGDIDAMWLRDSTNQVWPYLPFMKEDKKLQDLIHGLIRRQARCVRLDPYANAFFKDASRTSEWISDKTDMRPGVHERKYELDSLCAVLRLAYGYYQQTHDLTPFDAEWIETVELILDTIKIQQEGTLFNPPYRFSRNAMTTTETLALNGHGQPARRCGLSKSPFRPSDDAASLPFLIPANALAVVSLRHVAEILRQLPDTTDLASRANDLAASIEQGIRQHGIIHHKECGEIFAFEVDGYGSHYLMDDANIPSLLSLPYLGYIAPSDPLYQRTRAFALSDHNPYFFHGQAGEGIGGPHVGLGMIWPMATIMRCLTSDSEEEVSRGLSQLKHTHAGTGFIHETFWMDNASKFTRTWFAWANTLFGELILHVDQKFPALLSKKEF